MGWVVGIYALPLLSPAGRGEVVKPALVNEGVFRPGLDEHVEGLTEEGVVAGLVPTIGIGIEGDSSKSVDAPGNPYVEPAAGHMVEQR